MALAERFEDLRAWQAARSLTLGVYALARGNRFRRDFGLTDQIRRAAVSTMNNIAEGFDGASRVEFVRVLRYAARSASEVQSCLHVALDQAYVTQAEFDRTYAAAASVRKLCGGLIRSLRPPRRDKEPRVSEPAASSHGPSAVVKLLTSPVTGHRSPVTPF